MEDYIKEFQINDNKMGGDSREREKEKCMTLRMTIKKPKMKVSSHKLKFPSEYQRCREWQTELNVNP